VVKFVGSSIDVTERKQAEEERERLRQAQADLAHINRVTTMSELTASLAHEIKRRLPRRSPMPGLVYAGLLMMSQMYQRLAKPHQDS
jgi:hypothetical protein